MRFLRPIPDLLWLYQESAAAIGRWGSTLDGGGPCAPGQDQLAWELMPGWVSPPAFTSSQMAAIRKATRIQGYLRELCSAHKWAIEVAYEQRNEFTPRCDTPDGEGSEREQRAKYDLAANLIRRVKLERQRDASKAIQAQRRAGAEVTAARRRQDGAATKRALDQMQLAKASVQVKLIAVNNAEQDAQRLLSDAHRAYERVARRHRAEARKAYQEAGSAAEMRRLELLDEKLDLPRKRRMRAAALELLAELGVEVEA